MVIYIFYIHIGVGLNMNIQNVSKKRNEVHITSNPSPKPTTKETPKPNENGLDQFYTHPDIALKCLNTLQQYISLNDYDFHLEPSAGTGSFYNILDSKKRIGVDIDPKISGVICQDFFDFIPDKDTSKSYIAIGNPPFGKVSSLAVKFFNKCASFADCIAFIVPRTFKRVSIQNKLSMDFTLIYTEDLPLEPCCFSPKMTAKCCFQIWKKSPIPRKVVVYDKTHPDFIFVKHGPKDVLNQPTPPSNADFALKAYGSHCGTIEENNLHTLRPKSWHWIKSNIDVHVLKTRFTSLDYSMSRDTVRQDSIGQQELIYLYSLKY
mgnify:FL=1